MKPCPELSRRHHPPRTITGMFAAPNAHRYVYFPQRASETTSTDLTSLPGSCVCLPTHPPQDIFRPPPSPPPSTRRNTTYSPRKGQGRVPPAPPPAETRGPEVRQRTDRSHPGAFPRGTPAIDPRSTRPGCEALRIALPIPERAADARALRAEVSGPMAPRGTT